IFHFYLGDPVVMLQLHQDMTSEVIILGQKIDEGQQVQVVVPKGTWQGTCLREGGNFALMGTTMAPGFDFSDYVEGIRDSLIRQYPDQMEWIKKLTAP
ncbi:MAG TPA: cupin domain-containing protein, partial [bacterium]|nr:cupin domain-containing protein [bacterium]